WSKDENLSCSGFVGTEGTVTDMSEQISGTPKGFYPIGEAFYIYDAPQTKLNTFQITQNTNWIDDPDSAFYNQRVEGTENQDWNSCEHMIDYADSYAYGFVINYNMPAEYNKGSAIFMHIGSVPTQGCIATSTENILAYLSKLDCALNPYILII
ncbi:MAG: L,D-transpeptidase family protein, partial [Ruminococcus sp.]